MCKKLWQELLYFPRFVNIPSEAVLMWCSGDSLCSSIQLLKKNNIPRSNIWMVILNNSEISSFLQMNGVNQIPSHLHKDFFFPTLFFFSGLFFFPRIFSSAARRNDGACGNACMGTTGILSCSRVIQVESLENSAMVPAGLHSEIPASPCLGWITEMIQF